jgi:hypothetical protein
VRTDWGRGPDDDRQSVPDHPDNSARHADPEVPAPLAQEHHDWFGAAGEADLDGSESQPSSSPSLSASDSDEEPSPGATGLDEPGTTGLDELSTTGLGETSRWSTAGLDKWAWSSAAGSDESPALGTITPDEQGSADAAPSRVRDDAPAGQEPDARSVEASSDTPAYRPRARRWPVSLGKGDRAPRVARSTRLARSVWIVTAAGILLDAGAVILARKGYGIALPIFWMALLIPFAVQTAALMSVKLSERLRLVIIALIGLYPSVTGLMTSPLVLAGYDEHLHERQLSDLLHGSRLFAPDPMLSVGPYYPGLEILTGTTVRLTGISALLGEVLIPLLSRLLLVLLLYSCAKILVRNVRSTSLVVVFYAVSPQFYFFNAQFSYQTLALTLGLGGVYLAGRAQRSEGPRQLRLIIAASLAMVGTVITHHATSWFFAGFLILWALATQQRERKPVAWVAGTTVGAIVIWSAAISTQLVGYFQPVISGAAAELGSTVTGSSQGHVFSGSGANASPEWEHLVLIIYALVCTSAAVICGIRLLVWAYRRGNRYIALLGILSLCYPATLATHFVSAAAEIGDRSSTFFFFPVALSVAAVVTAPRGSSMSAMRKVPAIVLVPALAVLGSVYIGGVVLGAGPDYNMLPGSYLVSADMRTQDPYTLAAVEWAESHLAPGSRVVADRVPSNLLNAQARLWPIIAPANGLEPADLYFSPTWTSYQTSTVRGLHVQYIYADDRLSASLPHVGFYFYAGETSTPQQLTAGELTKFAHVSGLKAVYHLGPVAIYSTAGLGVTPDPAGFTGNESMGLGTLGDFLAGILVFVIGFLVRRRLKWAGQLAREAGAVGTTVVTMALLVIVGGVLFELRAVPGPTFTLGLIAGLLVAGFAKLGFAQAARRNLRVVMNSGALDPVILCAVLGFMLGVALAVGSAYHADVSGVHALLQQAGL